MKITEQMIRIYEMRVNGSDDLEEIKRVFSKSAGDWENTDPKDPDSVVIGDIVIPLRGIFAWMPLLVRDTAGLRQWKDDDGDIAGESRFFLVETLDDKTDQPTGLTFKVPIALLKEI